MRRIKYRAWDVVNKIMDDDIFIDGAGNTYDYASTTYNTPNTEIQRCDFPVMQYTGLKDKNGVEIFEGDLVENGNGKVGYIVFLIQEAGFVVVLKDRDYRLGHRNTGEGYNMADNHKVIGNIYENPEILEATK